MLIYEDKTFGTQECALNLEELYPNEKDRQGFCDKFYDFMQSDSSHQDIFSLQGDTLTYHSEVFVSDKKDHRPPVLLLLGNPASHSVAAGMCFAFEKGSQEHRFWRSLEETGILSFKEKPSPSAGPTEKIAMKQDALLKLKYDSPFRIGIAVFYSLPSAASAPKWSGVVGVRKLFGTKALRTIALQEKNRIDNLISKFMGSTGGIIAFQKDAYNGVRSHDSPEYSLDLAMQGKLRGKYKGGQDILLAGAPPTRTALWKQGKEALRAYKNWLSQQLD